MHRYHTAKDPASPYRPSATRSWLKVKVRRERRFLVGGVAVSDGGYHGLVVGEREGKRLTRKLARDIAAVRALSLIHI